MKNKPRAVWDIAGANPALYKRWLDQLTTDKMGHIVCAENEKPCHYKKEVTDLFGWPGEAVKKQWFEEIQRDCEAVFPEATAFLWHSADLKIGNVYLTRFTVLVLY